MGAAEFTAPPPEGMVLRQRGLKMKVRFVTLATCLAAAWSCSACSRSNNLLLGRVEAAVGGHTVVVTDCYRVSVPGPQKLEETAAGQPVYRFAPCRDAVVLIRGEELVVNGRSYGRIGGNDRVTVDHGRVLINERAALKASAD
jgi:hypothetical protein